MPHHPGAVCICLVLLASFLASGVDCDPVPKFLDCGSKQGKVVSLDISPCPKLPCELPRGTTANISITFVPSVASDSVTAVVHGIVAGVPVPFPLPDSNACHSLAPACPVAPGTQDVYTSSLEVKKSYPNVGVVVKWELKSSSGDDIVCLEVPARLV